MIRSPKRRRVENQRNRCATAWRFGRCSNSLWPTTRKTQRGRDEDSVRYAKKGILLLELELEYGAIEAKSRHRVEWRAHCYEGKLDHKHHPDEDAFTVELGDRYRRRAGRADTYYRQGYSQADKFTGRDGYARSLRGGVLR